jgi:hypothetical protein
MGQDDEVGKGEDPAMISGEKDDYQKLLDEDVATESRLLWSEIGILAFITLLIAAYLILSR